MTKFSSETLNFLDKRKISFRHLINPEKDRDILKNKKVLMLGGCEFTYLRDYLRTFQMDIVHSFEEHSSMNPYMEAINPNSSYDRTVQYDYIFLSQIQLYKPIILKFLKNIRYDQSQKDILTYNEELKQTCQILNQTQQKCQFFLITYPYWNINMKGVHAYKYYDDTYVFLNEVKMSQYRLSREIDNLYLLDCDLVFEPYGKNERLIRREVAGGHLEHFGAVLMGENFYFQISALDSKQKKIKCIVLDLDNTLWDGVIRETLNLNKLKLRKNEIECLFFLNRRGILVTICSKNDPDEWSRVEQVIKPIAPGFWRTILMHKLNWKPKSINIQEIAKQLNIGLDTIAFFDDNPRERDEVATALPMVKVLSDKQIIDAMNMVEFQPFGNITKDSESRGVKYQADLKRQTIQKQTLGDGHSLEDFYNYLRTTNLKVGISRLRNSKELDRVYELLSRTNQMNVTLKRTDLNILRSYHQNLDHEIFMCTMSDKMGDYGKIGTCIIKKSDDLKRARVLEYALSCRAMGIKIENILMIYMLNYLKSLGFQEVSMEITLTKKNKKANQMLTEEIGFQIEDTKKEQQTLIFPLKTKTIPSYPDWFAITFPEKI